MKYETPFDLPLDDYEGLIERNEYWDDSGDEANWLTMDQKLSGRAAHQEQRVEPRLTI